MIRGIGSGRLLRGTVGVYPLHLMPVSPKPHRLIAFQAFQVIEVDRAFAIGTLKDLHHLPGENRELTRLSKSQSRPIALNPAIRTIKIDRSSPAVLMAEQAPCAD